MNFFALNECKQSQFSLFFGAHHHYHKVICGSEDDHFISGHLHCFDSHKHNSAEALELLLLVRV